MILLIYYFLKKLMVYVDGKRKRIYNSIKIYKLATHIEI